MEFPHFARRLSLDNALARGLEVHQLNSIGSHELAPSNRSFLSELSRLVSTIFKDLLGGEGMPVMIVRDCCAYHEGASTGLLVKAVDTVTYRPEPIRPFD